MNLTKSILITMIIALGILSTSCSNTDAAAQIDQRSLILQKQNDSLIQANKDLSQLVTISVEDSSMQQFVKIPDHVKRAWWEYKQIKYAAEKEYEEAEKAHATTKTIAIKKAQAEQKTKHEQADGDYNKIEKAAVTEFSKNSNEFISFVSNSENANYYNPFLQSDESYWTLSISYDFKSHDRNYKEVRKMPQGFKKMIAVCRDADSIKNELKKSANQFFEIKKAEAETTYNEAITAPMKMMSDKISEAYMLYLHKIK